MWRAKSLLPYTVTWLGVGALQKGVLQHPVPRMGLSLREEHCLVLCVINFCPFQVSYGEMIGCDNEEVGFRGRDNL